VEQGSPKSSEKKKKAFKDWNKKRRSVEKKQTLKRLNKISKMKCAIAKATGYADLYKDLEDISPKEIYRLVATRQRRGKDIDWIVFTEDEQSKIESEEKDIKEKLKEYFKNNLVPKTEHWK